MLQLRWTAVRRNKDTLCVHAGTCVHGTLAHPVKEGWAHQHARDCNTLICAPDTRPTSTLTAARACCPSATLMLTNIASSTSVCENTTWNQRTKIGFSSKPPVIKIIQSSNYESLVYVKTVFSKPFPYKCDHCTEYSALAPYLLYLVVATSCLLRYACSDVTHQRSHQASHAAGCNVSRVLGRPSGQVIKPTTKTVHEEREDRRRWLRHITSGYIKCNAFSRRKYLLVDSVHRIWWIKSQSLKHAA